LQSRVEAPHPQAHRPLTPHGDRKSTHARCGGDHCGVNLSVRGEPRRRQCARRNSIFVSRSRERPPPLGPPLQLSRLKQTHWRVIEAQESLANV
jgi:hypothetical protein